MVHFLLHTTAHVSGMNVVATRSLEPIRGIEVMDKEGNVMGYSRKAGTKVGGCHGSLAGSPFG